MALLSARIARSSNGRVIEIGRELLLNRLEVVQMSIELRSRRTQLVDHRRQSRIALGGLERHQELQPLNDLTLANETAFETDR